jgi:hypothetical protein
MKACFERIYADYFQKKVDAIEKKEAKCKRFVARYYVKSGFLNPFWE